MSLFLDTPQGIADALGYLQHYLQKLTERQHISESNINSTLAALTTQLQQLTQLVTNSVRATGHKTPGESSVILQSVVMIQLTSRRILKD